MDFVQALDPSKLVLFETVLSFILSPFAAPPYNLAIFLFGTYAQENTEAIQSLQTFTGLVGASIVFDTVWMLKNEQGGLAKFLTLVVLLVKIPTFLAFGIALRQRGAGLGLRGPDLNGAPVWSMPGGFMSNGREGYQTVDEERAVPPSRPTAHVTPVPKPQSAQPPAVPGAYQAA